MAVKVIKSNVIHSFKISDTCFHVVEGFKTNISNVHDACMVFLSKFFIRPVIMCILFLFFDSKIFISILTFMLNSS